MTTRKQRLTPNLHPTGTRFVGTWDKVLFEATIAEWSPSGNLVCLTYEDNTQAWKSEMPIVVEVLERPSLRLPTAPYWPYWPPVPVWGGPYEITCVPAVTPFKAPHAPTIWIGDPIPGTITASISN